jgi:hypothetical protein
VGQTFIEHPVPKYVIYFMGMILWGSAVAALFLDWPNSDHELGGAIHKRSTWNGKSLWEVYMVILIAADGLTM